MNSASVIRTAITRCCAAGCVLFAASPAMAQIQGVDSLSDRAQRSMSLQMPQGLDFIDLSAGPGRRPHGSLKFRFEGATKALRGFGMDADDCRTLLRTTSRRTPPANGGASSGDGAVRLGVTVSLNCSFF